MDTGKLVLLVHTLKYLRFKQIYYRGYYFIRNRFFKKDYQRNLDKDVQPLIWKDSFLYTNSYKKSNTFEFLNITHSFTGEIDWNYSDFGKLWTYNLNYFDFLNQQNSSFEKGIDLVRDYIAKDALLKDGKEPYPISLRGINWIKFISKHKIEDKEISQNLYNHYQILLHNLEYHLLGNHLLENGFSLFFGAYYFKNEKMFKKAVQILQSELKEQILLDGAHFELSPMYHQILLHRLLDCISLSRANAWDKNTMTPFLEEKALKMLSWLQAVTFSNGNIPMVNDCAYGIAPTSQQLFNYAKELHLDWNEVALSDSGYRKFTSSAYELFVDIGNIGPSYQPGHAHSDTFSFELYVGGKPIIVDTGTSTYEKNALRQEERETKAHNTVKIGNQEQSQVWGGFRVAKRAKVDVLEDSKDSVKAQHDGYKNLGVYHSRKFSSNTTQIIIEDELSKTVNKEQIAYFHFHPSVIQIEIEGNRVQLKNENVYFQFGASTQLEVLPYQYALGFNKTAKAKKIAVSFKNSLKTTIEV